MKRLRALAAALALCLVLSGCWDSDDEEDDFWEAPPEPSSIEEPEPEPQAAVFTLPLLVNRTLDPITASDLIQQGIGSLLYEGLFALDGSFTPHEVLCESYHCDESAAVYTFHLRSDVTFSDGSPLNASDVLAAYRRAAVSPRYSARFANVASTRVVNGELVITLAAPDSAFPALLDIPIVKAGTEKDPVPLGTGPYFFATDSGGACLLRNDNWPRGAQPPLERIALVSAKDIDSAVYLFSAQNAHLLTADLLSETSAAALGGVDISDAPTSTLLYLGFRGDGELTGSAPLRRAVSAALDREAIAASVLAQHAVGTQFPISPRSPLYPQSLETPFALGAYQAALPELLPEEGAALTLLVNAENPFKVSLGEHLCRALTAQGLTVEPRVLPWADYLAAMDTGDFDLYLGEVRLTADWDLSALLALDGKLNYGHCGSDELDQLISAFLADENEATCAALCACFAQEEPIVPLAFKSLSTLTPSGLCDGISPTAADPFYEFGAWTIRLAGSSDDQG